MALKIKGFIPQSAIRNPQSAIRYGTSYLRRAFIALIGLGANVAEDAVYPMSNVDSEGTPYNGSHRYVLHFDKGELPPTRGFWSLSMYDDEMYFVDNPIRTAQEWPPVSHGPRRGGSEHRR